MSVLARASALRHQVVRSRAGVRSMSYDHIPFSFKNRPVFALKVIGYLGLGFGVPVLASAYQLKKAGGVAA
ncbi:hypothetical protein JAAARDRAFT_28511 [Jaapia argillacea MUCL 33604]|uniref:Cytochrome c oxidase subunit 8, mitochondrial n=1 Tax=Jaapia argillacea MUCL 33604 TaxID=933084 RepID=A0A067QFD1_9AGAM|nr:hypothetical protein JAAARDRAFT_28511 [Jaapia argillacea MUCL 33604]